MNASFSKSKTLKSRFISGGSWAITGKIISGASTLGVNILLARLLSPEDMGSFFLTLSIVTTFTVIGQWGLGRGLVKLVASEMVIGGAANARNAIISSFIIVILLCFILALFMYSPIGSWFLRRLSGTDILAAMAGLIGLWIIGLALQGIVSESFRGFHDIRLATIYGGMVSAVLSMIFYFIAWFSDVQLELKYVVQIMILAVGISVLTGSFFLFRRTRVLEKKSKLEISKVARFGLPLMLTNLSLFATLQFHMWVLAYYQPETEVALYGASLRLVMLLAMPLTIINAVIPPIVAEMYSRKKYERVQNLLQKTATIMSVPAFIVFVIVIVFGKDILGLIYGEAYAVAYVPFVILAVGQFVNVLTGSPGILLTMSGHEKIVFKTALFASVIGLITSIVAVQTYGAVGAALGYTVGIIINNVAMWTYSIHSLSIRTHGSLVSMKEMLERLREDIESNDVNGGPLAFLGKPVAKLELLWWQICGYEIFECYGDSHVQIFRGLNYRKWIGRRRYRTVAVKGATAHGIGNPNSSTNALHIFTSKLSEVPKERSILFMMGEVDVGFLVWLKAKKKNISANTCMEEAFQRYTRFLSDVRVDHPHIKVCSVPLPTISDGEVHGDVANARSEIDATQKERTKLTLEFNQLLKAWSIENSIEYFDFDLLALDEETKIVKKSLLNKNASDHHYDNKEFHGLIKKVLNL